MRTKTLLSLSALCAAAGLIYVIWPSKPDRQTEHVAGRDLREPDLPFSISPSISAKNANLDLLRTIPELIRQRVAKEQAWQYLGVEGCEVPEGARGRVDRLMSLKWSTKTEETIRLDLELCTSDRAAEERRMSSIAGVSGPANVTLEIGDGAHIYGDKRVVMIIARSGPLCWHVRGPRIEVESVSRVIADIVETNGKRLVKD